MMVGAAGDGGAGGAGGTGGGVECDTALSVEKLHEVRAMNKGFNTNISESYYKP